MTFYIHIQNKIYSGLFKFFKNSMMQSNTQSQRKRLIFEDRECKRRMFEVPQIESRNSLVRPATPPLEKYLAQLDARETSYLMLPPNNSDLVRFLNSPPTSPVPDDWHLQLEDPPMLCPDPHKILAEDVEKRSVQGNFAIHRKGKVIFSDKFPVIQVDSYEELHLTNSN